MNYLYLIGNGFDLAHNLPTSYKAFVYDFFLKSVSTIYPHEIKDIGPCVIRKAHNSIKFEKDVTLKELFEISQLNNIQFDFSNSFFEYITKNFKKERWVDIEYAYYIQITDFVKGMKHIMQPYDYSDEMLRLNCELNEIKSMLIDYLKRIIETNIIKKNDFIDSHIRNVHKGIDGQNLFLNFNYTNIIEKYIEGYRGDEIINIHGSLDDKLDDIIFGYGDEMDSMYQEIEALNNNAFLNNFKSFGYLKKSHYQRVQSFLGSDFEVIIMGHSCGISDRVLLNSIFTNDNCKKIHICYHQRSETENDFFEKTQEISRHFGKANKEEMRIKIVPFDQSKPLIPFSKN